MMNTRILFLLFCLTVSLQAQSPSEFRAVKLTNVDSDVLFDDHRIADAMNYLASIGINVVLPVVWNGSGTTGDCTLYPSQVMADLFGIPIHPAFLNRDPLERIVIEAHRNGMEVLPWFEMGFATSYSQEGGHILENFPEWALLNAESNLVVKNGFDWMSGINPEVQYFMLLLVLEILDHYDIDGIEFSDRMPAMPVEGGYDAVTVQLYRDEHNGNDPPLNFRDRHWKQWRAAKLTDFYRMIRDSVKARSPHLLVSSSPSLYPWSYEEYLQDSKTWVEQRIVDNIIPQVYRYNLADYTFELNKSIANFPGFTDNYFAGMLIQVGNYTIDTDFFLQALAANRARNVHGEAFFFYEGLRKDNDRLGIAVAASYYKQPALLPHRGGSVWRPPATIVNETDSSVQTSGEWMIASAPGFDANVLINENTQYASLSYEFKIIFAAWYDVYVYGVVLPAATTSARYTLYSDSDSTVVSVDQSNPQKNGWQNIGTVYSTQGTNRILKLDNSLKASNEKLIADAAMLILNRKLSPDALITAIDQPSPAPSKTTPRISDVYNFPNPFNNQTSVNYFIQNSGWVELRIFDILGSLVKKRDLGIQPAGRHQISVDLTDFSSGIYVYEIRTTREIVQRKMLYLK